MKFQSDLQTKEIVHFISKRFRSISGAMINEPTPIFLADVYGSFLEELEIVPKGFFDKVPEEKQKDFVVKGNHNEAIKLHLTAKVLHSFINKLDLGLVFKPYDLFYPNRVDVEVMLALLIELLQVKDKQTERMNEFEERQLLLNSEINMKLEKSIDQLKELDALKSHYKQRKKREYFLFFSD